RRISREMLLDPIRGESPQAVNDGIGTGLAKLGSAVGMADADRPHTGSLGRDDSSQTILDDQALSGFQVRPGLGLGPQMAPQRLQGLQVASGIGLALVGILGRDDGHDPVSAVPT